MIRELLFHGASVMKKIKEIQTLSEKVLSLDIRKNKLISAGKDGMIYIWNTDDWTLEKKIGRHNDFITCVRFFPSENKIISTGKDKTLRVWDAETGTFIRDYSGIVGEKSAKTLVSQNFKPSILGHTKTILKLAFGPDDLMATAGQDNMAKLWKAGEPVRSFEWHSRPVTDLCFQPQSQTLFTCSRDATIRSWNNQTGAMVDKYEGHTAEIIFMAFLNENRFVSADNTGKILAWDVGKERTLGCIYDTQGTEIFSGTTHENKVYIGLQDGRVVAVDAEFKAFARERQPDFELQLHKSEVRSLIMHETTLYSADNSGIIVVSK